MKRLLALAVLVAACAAGGGSASAEPPHFRPVAKLCQAQGGIFYTDLHPGYGCRRGRFLELFSEEDLERASRLCEHAYAGTFQVFGTPDEYHCLFAS